MKRSAKLLLVIGVLAFASCEDFIEPDISNKNIAILAPVDSFSGPSLTITFWWEELTGVESYQLQVVKPTFSATQQIVLDTLVADDKFVFSFSTPGAYQWRIRGVNNGSQTNYTVRSFSIDSTLDLTGQVVGLISPATNLFTNENQVSFLWQDIYNAETYRFQLLDALSSIVILDTVVSTTQISRYLDEGSYIWKVNASNSMSYTVFSSRNITIDNTNPIAPFNFLPVNNDTLSSPVDLSWETDTDVLTDSLIIYDDSLMSSINMIQVLSSSQYSFSGSSGISYFWRVRSLDKAGNPGPFSSLLKFHVQ